MTDTGSDSPAGLAFLRARAAGGGVPQRGTEAVRSGAEVVWSGAETASSRTVAEEVGSAAGESGASTEPNGVRAGAPDGHADPVGRRAGEVVEGCEQGVEAALSALGRLDGMPVPEHVGVFEEVLTRLEAALTSVDEPAGDAPR